MGFSRQEYWSGLAFPSPGDLPDPGIEPASPVSPALAGGFFATSSTWKALAVDLNLTQQCKSTILQYKIKLRKKKVWVNLVCVKPLFLCCPQKIWSYIFSWTPSFKLHFFLSPSSSAFVPSPYPVKIETPKSVTPVGCHALLQGNFSTLCYMIPGLTSTIAFPSGAPIRCKVSPHFCPTRLLSSPGGNWWEQREHWSACPLLTGGPKNLQGEIWQFLREPWKTKRHIYRVEIDILLIAQSCPILHKPMDCNPTGSSVHRILQIRILEWGAIPFSRESSWPRDRTRVSCIAGRFFTIWATREVYLVVNIINHKIRIQEIKCVSFIGNIIFDLKLVNPGIIIKY